MLVQELYTIRPDEVREILEEHLGVEIEEVRLCPGDGCIEVTTEGRYDNEEDEQDDDQDEETDDDNTQASPKIPAELWMIVDCRGNPIIADDCLNLPDDQTTYLVAGSFDEAQAQCDELRERCGFADQPFRTVRVK